MAEFEDTNEDNVEEVCDKNIIIYNVVMQIQKLSSEEKLQISQHYLLSSPPGQFNEVLSGTFYIVDLSLFYNVL